jgi:hypothetical protein
MFGVELAPLWRITKQLPRWWEKMRNTSRSPRGNWKNWSRSNHVTSEEGQLRSQVLSLNQIQRDEETKTNQIVGQLHQLTLLLNQVQQDLQQHKLKVPNNAVLPEPSPNLIMPQWVPIEDAVLQLQIELQVVQSQLRSDSVRRGLYI